MHYPLLTQHQGQVARLAATRKRLDIFAACVFALVTATGGGTVRDILIGAPVFWLTDSWPIIACVGVAAAVWIVPLQRWPAQTIEWLDAVGLVAYAVYGVSKALGYGLQPLQAAAVGTLSACMGGIIRDVIAGVPSILLRHELYVTAAMLAAGLYVSCSLLGLPNEAAVAIGAIGGFALRAAAIRFG